MSEPQQSYEEFVAELTKKFEDNLAEIRKSWDDAIAAIPESTQKSVDELGYPVYPTKMINSLKTDTCIQILISDGKGNFHSFSQGYHGDIIDCLSRSHMQLLVYNIMATMVPDGDYSSLEADLKFTKRRIRFDQDWGPCELEYNGNVSDNSPPV